VKYKFSRCICFEHPQQREMRALYRDLLGFEEVDQSANTAELRAGNFRLFLDRKDQPTVAFELLVPNAEEAKAELLAKGFELLRWDGPGKSQFLRDPFGIIFNLYEEPEAFK